MKPRDLAAAGAICIAAAAFAAGAPFGRLAGLSLDSLFWLRHQIQDDGTKLPPRVAVIAIDEETYRRPPFQSAPKVMWTPQIARVIDAAVAADAAVVGFDLILPTSVERFVPGHDRDFLIALRRASQQGKILLGKVQHQTSPISPFPGQSFAVGNARNIRSVNVEEDADGIIRRVPLWFRATGTGGAGRIEPSIAMELAARASRLPIRIGPDAPVRFGDREVPLRAPADGMLLDFDTRPGAIPTYSLADLHACAEAGDTDYFHRHFAGRVVLVGSVLDVEDRKLTSMRFATSPDGAGLPERCRLPVMTSLYRSDLRRDAVPGVYIHATAVNNLLRGELISEPSPAMRGLVGLALSAVAVAAALLMSAWWAGAIALGALAVWTAVATALFANGTLLPLLDPAAAAAAAFVLAFGFRFTVADRDKRKLRQAFSLYLPAPEVERLVASDEAPALGGESRVLTVLFSDIAGFTRISESLSPAELVSFLNRYLSLMTDTIEEHGGIVDKYIGDAVIGVFGAPLENPDHAACAVRAALACQRRLAERRADLGLDPAIPLATRIGINTGEMVIGNVGSARRFNYTVMGDAVNLAARLEGANKAFGTGILVSEETRDSCTEDIAFRAIARVRVVGREEPTGVFEPRETATAEDSAFERARALFEDGRFADSAAAFAALGATDPAAASFRARAEAMSADPPGPGWVGVIDLESK
jgi:adenylate cyclase